MRTPSLLARRALTVAAAAALPLAGAAPSLAAGVDVTADGSTVTATTTACPHGGDATLLDSGQADFTQGRRATLVSGRAVWQGLGPGTYQTVVICSDGSTLGPVPVTVTARPATAPVSHPAGGVRGGLGGTVRDTGTLTLAVGGALVAVASVGAAWYLRRRALGRHG